LDGDARRAVWDGVRALTAEGTSVVLTTHYLEEADALADRVVVLDDGRVIADDDANAIRTRVSGAVIQCATHLAQHEVASLPAVRSVRAHGRLLDVLCDDAPTTLAALLARDATPTELTVRKPSLEEAFARLTRQDEEAHS
ncbi:MAG: ABC transporter ATP-binding protein, partial [Pseudomonadota bacterium]